MKPHNGILGWLAAVTSCISIVLALVLLRQHASYQSEVSRLAFRLNWIEDSAAKLQIGDSALTIYSMKNADRLLSIFSHRLDVTAIHVEMTDVTAEGIRVMSTMPALEEVGLAGNPVSDEMLQLLASCESLETVRLSFAQVSPSGLRFLAQSDSLHTLTLEANWTAEESEEVLRALQPIGTLRRLEVGSWANGETLRALKDALPNCVIVQQKTLLQPH